MLPIRTWRYRIDLRMDLITVKCAQEAQARIDGGSDCEARAEEP